MGYLALDDASWLPGTGGSQAPVIYVVDAPDHPFGAQAFEGGRTGSVIRVPVRTWQDACTPWPAEALYRGSEPFGGKAAETLVELRDALPALEARWGIAPDRRAVCGYSLGGLFALHAFLHDPTWSACGCLSGSLWYEGWTEWMCESTPDLRGRYAYLSLGSKERRAARPLLKTVQERTEACVELLRDAGCAVDYRVVPGNHLSHVDERVSDGLAALDAWLCR